MKNLFKIFIRAKKYWGYLLITMIATLVQTGIAIYSPLILSGLVDLFSKPTADILNIALKSASFLLILYITQAIMQFIRSYFSHLAAWRFVHEIRTNLYNHIQNLSLKYFSDKQTGQLMSRIFRDTDYLEVLIAHAAPDLIVNILMIFGVGIIMFFINYRLALVSVVTFPIICIAAWIFITKVRPVFKKSHAQAANVNAVLQDNLSGIKEIQAFNQQEYELEKINKESQKHIDLVLFALKRSAVFHPSVTLISQIGIVLVVAAGGIIAASSRINPGDIVAFLLYLNMFYQPVVALARLTEDLQNSSAAVDRIIEVFETESDIKEPENAKNIGRVKGGIEFKDVCFGYNGDKDVLNGFNLKIEPGECVAFVGATGVGKTTLANLVPRFYDTASGCVLIDSENVKDVSLKSLRDNISIVLQDVFLFNGTVYDNIAYSNKDATREQVEKAAEIANASEFINKMEQGYDTYIGERGVRLSGGQKQRISIARAVLRNAPILILDEATASVDNETEQLIHQAINNVIKDRTTILIAHRLSTVKNADKICVIDDGKIAEMGTHDELMVKNGLYAKLHCGE